MHERSDRERLASAAEKLFENTPFARVDGVEKLAGIAHEPESVKAALEELVQIAQASGLQWVNSDADKVASVQAAIAAEPRPIHVPRERPPVVLIDEGPLVLVETRRDLSELKLPFEQTPGA